MTADTISTNELAGTLLASCSLCESDFTEPVGVTGRMDDPGDATVVMRCSDCSLLYLSPMGPTSAGPAPDSFERALSRSRVRQITQELPPRAKILILDAEGSRICRLFAGGGAAQWRISRCGGEQTESYDRMPRWVREDEPYELIILPFSLESARHPGDLLADLSRLLAPKGRIVLLGANAGSFCCALFSGRHWCGFRYPHARQFFQHDSIQRLCERAGLCVRDAKTLFGSGVWLHSLANLLDDWRLPRVLRAIATGPWLVPQITAAALEGVALLRGRAALILVELERR